MTTCVHFTIGDGRDSFFRVSNNDTEELADAVLEAVSEAGGLQFKDVNGCFLVFPPEIAGRTVFVFEPEDD